MLASFLLSLREGLEAALIIGIVLGVLLKIKRTELNGVVWRGVGPVSYTHLDVYKRQVRNVRRNLSAHQNPLQSRSLGRR